MSINPKYNRLRWNVFIGTKKPVPYSKYIPVITVRIGLYVMMMNAVHSRGYEEKADQHIDCLGQFYIGMIKLRQQGTYTLVEHHYPKRRTANQYCNRSKYRPEYAFARMVAVGTRGIHTCIRMMDEVKTPHPPGLMFDKVNEIRPYKIKQQQRYNYPQCKRQGYPVPGAKLVIARQLTSRIHQECEGKVDCDSSKGEEKIDPAVFPFIVPEKPDRYNTLDDPEQGNAPKEDKGTVQGGNSFKIINNTVHNNKLDTIYVKTGMQLFLQATFAAFPF